MPAALPLRRCAFVLAACATAGQHTDAAVIFNSSVIKIADTNTLMPNGGSLVFNSFGRPAISGINVAFYGRSTGSTIRGIYHNIGALTRVADDSIAAPFGAGNLNPDVHVDIEGNTVVFLHSSTGVLTGDGASIGIVASTSTPSPVGAGFLSSFDRPSISPNGVTFVASVGATRAVYDTVGGGVNRVIDTTMPVPGGVAANTGTLLNPMISGANKVFYLVDDTVTYACICAEINGTLVPIMDTPTAGTNTSFDSLPSISGENVVWSQAQDGLAGAIRVRGRINGAIEEIAVIGQVAPDSGTTMLRFGAASIDGETVSFRANNDVGVFGIFVRAAGQIHTVQLNTQPLDGKTIQSVEMSQFAIDSNNIAFKANFTDGSSGIFMASFTVTHTPDIDDDGVVDGADLAALLAGWGGPGPSDLNGDGTTGGADLATLLANWTP